ncbi:MAG: hypothetical protein ACRD3E_03130 [Terriglobales bacterium]
MRISWRGPRLLVLLLVLTGVAGASTTNLSVSAATQPMVLGRSLQSKNATEAAAAAYWLGFKGTDAVPEIPQLVAVLGDARTVQPWRYRHDVSPSAHTTPGEEAAGALARIGKPAVDPLIATLRTSSSSFARQNAAWALGQIDSSNHTLADSAPNRASRSKHD